MDKNVNSRYNQRIENLFKKLDKNNDGIIQLSEIKKALCEIGNSDFDDAKMLYEKIKHKSDEINFRDFVRYIADNEKNTKLVFSDIDLNKDGKIEMKEIKAAFEKSNIKITDQDLSNLMKHIDSDNSLKIDWEEWRDFFELAPYDQLEDILKYWRRRTFVEFGENVLPQDYTLEEKQSGYYWRSLISESTTGIIIRSCTAPLERVKTCMQVKGDVEPRLTTTIKSLIKEGGIRSLWRGNGMNVLKLVPEKSLKLLTYEQIKSMLGKSGEQLQFWEKIFYGSGAGFIAQTLVYPLDVLKTRMALRSTSQYAGVFDCIRQMYKVEGLKTFYKGNMVNTIGIPTAGAVDFAVYQTLKDIYIREHAKDAIPSLPMLLLIANTSSTVAMFTCYPLFLVRTKIQSSNVLSNSLIAVSLKIAKTEGFLGFYHGCLPNIVKLVPAASLGCIVDNKLSQVLGIQNRK